MKTSCFLSHSIPPRAFFCHCVSIRLSLCLSCDPSIISISPWCAVLFRLIASPAPVFLSPSLPLSMLLFSCTLHPIPSPLPPSCYLSLTPSFFFHCHSLHHSVCPSSCHHASCCFLSTCHILCFAGYSKFVTLSHSFFMSCVSSLLHDAII